MDRAEQKRIAFELRAKDEPYSVIMRETGVAKSTLSYWFRDLRPSIHQSKEAYEARWKEIRQKGSDALKRIRAAEIAEITTRCQKEVSSYPLQDISVQSAMLSVLYWAEGSKYPSSQGMSFANTAPRLSLLFLTLLRNCYHIEEGKLHISLHLHYYHKKREAVKFWSELLDVPAKQFYSAYVKKRGRGKRKRHNFQGICFIRYYNTNLQIEMLEKAFEIQKNVSTRP